MSGEKENYLIKKKVSKNEEIIDERKDTKKVDKKLSKNEV